MKQLEKASPMDAEQIEERIEAYVDGELSRRERLEFEAACAADPALWEEVRAARIVRNGLRSLETPHCPPEVTDAILDQVRRDARSRRGSPAWSWVGSWRPALAGFAVIVAAAVFVFLRPAPVSEVPTDPEVAEALDEVKWTLAYINSIGNRTGETIRDDVLRDHVVRPIERGLGIVPPATPPR